MRKFLTLSLLTFGFIAFSQDNPIFTDRPNVTDAVPLIAPGTFQVELGYANTKTQNAITTAIYQQTIPNLSIKYGWLDWLELRILTNYLVNKIDVSGFETERGITPITFSPKFGLLKQNGAAPRTSLVTNFTFPNIGSQAYQVDKLNFGLSLLFEYGFGQFTWSNSAGTTFTDDPNWVFTSVGSYAFTGKLGAFLELFGTSNRFEDRLGVDFGLTYLLAHNFQVDVIYGTHIAGSDYRLIGFGIAWMTNFKD